MPKRTEISSMPSIFQKSDFRLLRARRIRKVTRTNVSWEDIELK